MNHTNSNGPDLIRQWRDVENLTQSQLATVAGLSVSHLAKIEQEDIKKPSKELIISIGLSLNRTLNDINLLLDSFGLASLRAGDVQLFIKSAKKQGISAVPVARYGANVMVSALAIEYMTREAEAIATTGQIYSGLFSQKNFPIAFKGSSLYGHSEKNPLYEKIIEAVHRERNILFHERVSSTPITHYICKDCFDDYFKRMSGYIEKQQNSEITVESFFQEVIDTLNRTNYRIFLTEYCCGHEIYISTTNSELNKSKLKKIEPKQVVMFLSRQNTSKKHKIEKSFQLGVILSESKELVSIFKKEIDFLSRRLETSSNTETIKYIERLINGHVL